jgi:hypothetical protein
VVSIVADRNVAGGIVIGWKNGKKSSFSVAIPDEAGSFACFQVEKSKTN